MFQILDDSVPIDAYGRVLVFGHTGVGKSTLGSTMPGKTFIIAADPNSGAPLRRNFKEVPRVWVPPNKKDRMPAFYGQVDTWEDIAKCTEWLEANAKKQGIKSIVVDSLTAIHEILQAFIAGSKQKSMMQVTKLTQQEWGIIFLRLDALRQTLHGLECHVLWLCGAKAVALSNEPNAPKIWSPDLIGQSATRFPSQCLASLWIERKKGITQILTRNNGEVQAKDNTGLLPPICQADMELILHKMDIFHSSEYTESKEFKAALAQLAINSDGSVVGQKTQNAANGGGATTGTKSLLVKKKD